MTIIKWIYNGFKKSSAGLQLKTSKEFDEGSEAKNPGSSVHSTPPGEWPAECRQPSKLAVLLFYISVVATFIGSIMTIRTLFYTDIDLQQILIGCGLVSIGIILLCITNCIHNHEQKSIMAYLQGQIEKMGLDENSRAKRNLRYSAHLHNHDENQMLA